MGSYHWGYKMGCKLQPILIGGLVTPLMPTHETLNPKPMKP